MQIVIKAMNFIKSKGVNNCQFQEFLKSMDDDYGVVIHFFEERWLSCGKMLKKTLQSEIKSSMELKGKFVPGCED